MHLAEHGYRYVTIFSDTRQVYEVLYGAAEGIGNRQILLTFFIDALVQMATLRKSSYHVDAVTDITLLIVRSS